MTTKRTIGVVALVVAGLYGCASPDEAPIAASPASPAPVAPSSEPVRPPQGANDKPADPVWVVGTVTTGGTGPCYSLTTDDGTQYALYSPQGTSLVQGTKMRVRTERANVRIGCGPGKLVEMTAAEPVR
jgi:hypothetical protein